MENKRAVVAAVIAVVGLVHVRNAVAAGPNDGVAGPKKIGTLTSPSASDQDQIPYVLESAAELCSKAMAGKIPPGYVASPHMPAIL